eukprot:1669111-Prymnesium_polylepis.1
MTRVDCAMEMSTLCSCVGDPRTIYRDWAFVIMGYMVSTKSLGITYALVMLLDLVMLYVFLG